MGKNFAESTAQRMHTDLSHFDFRRKKMVSDLLKIAVAVSMQYHGTGSISFRSMTSALECAEKEDYEGMSLIATEKIRRETPEENVNEERLQRFFHKCLDLSSTEIQHDERPEYFDVVKIGLEFLQKKQPDICYGDIFG